MNKIRHIFIMVFLLFVSLALVIFGAPVLAGYRTLRYGDLFFASIAFRWMRIATAFLSASGVNADLTIVRKDLQ